MQTRRLLDGTLIEHVANDKMYFYTAADSAFGLVFAGVKHPPYLVYAWSWVPSAPGQCVTDRGSLVSLGSVAAAGESTYYRTLTVMPPTSGKRASYLIVGIYLSSELRVLSLPGCALVHTHSLDGMWVIGLAADPYGTALVVCDHESYSTHVLPWRCQACHSWSSRSPRHHVGRTRPIPVGVSSYIIAACEQADTRGIYVMLYQQ